MRFQLSSTLLLLLSFTFLDAAASSALRTQSSWDDYNYPPSLYEAIFGSNADPVKDITQNLVCHQNPEGFTLGGDLRWDEALRADCYAAVLWIKTNLVDDDGSGEDARCWNPSGAAAVYVKTVGSCSIAVEDFQDRGPDAPCLKINREIFLASSYIARHCGVVRDDVRYVSGETTFFVDSEDEEDYIGYGFTVYVGHDPHLESKVEEKQFQWW